MLLFHLDSARLPCRVGIFLCRDAALCAHTRSSRQDTQGLLCSPRHPFLSPTSSHTPTHGSDAHSRSFSPCLTLRNRLPLRRRSRKVRLLLIACVSACPRMLVSNFCVPRSLERFCVRRFDALALVALLLLPSSTASHPSSQSHPPCLARKPTSTRPRNTKWLSYLCPSRRRRGRRQARQARARTAPAAGQVRRSGHGRVREAERVADDRNRGAQEEDCRHRTAGNSMGI